MAATVAMVVAMVVATEVDMVMVMDATVVMVMVMVAAMVVVTTLTEWEEAATGIPTIMTLTHLEKGSPNRISRPQVPLALPIHPV